MFRVLCTLCLFCGFPALAEIPKTLAQAEVAPGWRDGSTHIAGITLRMAPGWHTYWRTPGAVGIPPSFNWSGSQNVSDVSVRFPVPEVYDDDGTQSLVYFDEVMLPVVIKVGQSEQPVRLRGEIEIGVCEEICVPVTLRVDATLDATGGRDRRISNAMANVPETGQPMTCKIKPIVDGVSVSATTAMPRVSGNLVAVLETSNPTVWVSPPTLQQVGNRLTATVDMVPPNAKPFALARSDVRMTIFADGRAIEMIGCN